MCAAFLVAHGAADKMKLLVQPESKIAVLSVVATINDGIQSKVNVN
jgi:hypothetical protein